MKHYRTIDRIPGLIRISRPAFWPIIPTAYLIGLSYGPNGLSHPGFSFTPIMLIQLFLLSFPFCLFTFGINDLHDLESDRINPRKANPSLAASLTEGSLSQDLNPKDIHITTAIIATLMLASAILSRSLLNMFHTLSLLVLSFTYSTPPWRLKTRPPLDMISGGILISLSPFAMGFSLVDETGIIPIQIYLLTFAAMGFHGFSTIMDADPDHDAGDTTFAVVFGKRTAALVAAAGVVPVALSIHTPMFNYFACGCGFLFLLTFLYPSAKVARFVYLFIFASGIVMAWAWLSFFLFGSGFFLNRSMP